MTEDLYILLACLTFVALMAITVFADSAASAAGKDDKLNSSEWLSATLLFMVCGIVWPLIWLAGISYLLGKYVFKLYEKSKNKKDDSTGELG